MHARPRFIVAATLIATAPYAAAWDYGDWTITCDNVKRCEAVGYGRNEDIERWIALALVREAGPNTVLQATLAVEGDDPDTKHGPVGISIDGRRLENARFNQPMPVAAAQRLVRAMIDARRGEIREGARRWPMPMKGMKAALLKMDEVQGRVGTPGALARTGTRPEASVPPAPPMPTLRAVAPARYVDDPALTTALIAQLPAADTGEYGHHALYRFPDGRLLLLRESSRGSYQSFHDVWLANSRPPYAPRQLRFPTLGRQTEQELVAADFDGQVIGSYAVARTQGACTYATTWLWTGHKFELLSLHHPEPCAGFADAVEHRKYIARKAGALKRP